MSKNTLIFALEGDISLKDFTTAIKDFNELINDLTKEVASEAQIEWIIEELSSSSAMVKTQGFSKELMPVEKVVNAYEIIGKALAEKTEIPYSTRITKRAKSLTKIINSQIKAIRFETQDAEWYVSAKSLKTGEPYRIKYNLGSVKGHIQTLSERNYLSFTLWDSLFDKSFKCYAETDNKELMRNIWGKKAIVFGRIGRDPDTGKPINIRNITKIDVVEDALSGSYKQAKGIILSEETDESPEEAIRRLRDEWEH